MPIDFSSDWNTGVKIINETISLLPNILLAFLFSLRFCYLGRPASLSRGVGSNGSGNIRESLC
jgi:hypothetical protein